MIDSTHAVKFHTELNPKLWENSKLIPRVRYKLLKIAKNFIDFINIPNISLKNIIITGSNAAYAYTQYSDIDLHLIVDLQGDDELTELFNAKKGLWNVKHDVTIHNIEVEVYVQDSHEVNHSNGMYSILDDSWIIKPKHVEAKIDDMSVVSKYRQYMREIRTLIKGDDVNEMNKLRERIKKMRKNGLDDHGEFGVENITFKLLRNQKWIAKLYNRLLDLEDREMSLENMVDSLLEACLKVSMLTESTQDRNKLKDQAKRFVEFAADELTLEKLPKVTFTFKSRVESSMPSFGQFDPNNNQIIVSVPKRHVMDIFRTLAHELVHYRQNLDGVLHAKSGLTGSKHENEANARAGVIMRNFAKQNPDFFNQSDELDESRPSKTAPTYREIKAMGDLYANGENPYKIGLKYDIPDSAVIKHLRTLSNWNDIESQHNNSKLNRIGKKRKISEDIFSRSHNMRENIVKTLEDRGWHRIGLRMRGIHTRFTATAETHLDEFRDLDNYLKRLGYVKTGANRLITGNNNQRVHVTSYKNPNGNIASVSFETLGSGGHTGTHTITLTQDHGSR